MPLTRQLYLPHGHHSCPAPCNSLFELCFCLISDQAREMFYKQSIPNLLEFCKFSQESELFCFNLLRNFSLGRNKQTSVISKVFAQKKLHLFKSRAFLFRISSTRTSGSGAFVRCTVLTSASVATEPSTSCGGFRTENWSKSLLR